MAFFKTMTQGGQVHIHQLRMLKQVVCAGLIVSLIIGGGYFTWKCLTLPNYAWRMAYETYWAKFMVITNPEVNHQRLTQIYTPPIKWAPLKWAPLKGGSPPTQGQAYERRCLTILSDPILQKTTRRVERYVEIIGYKSLKMALWSFLIVMGFWFIYGLAQMRKQHQRGTTLAPWKRLKQLIKRNREASYFKIKLKPWGKLPLLKNKETSHILLTGTTGSGKTNAFHILLPQIRKMRHRAIIVDVTGDYVSRYYDPDKDIILNPLDTRSKNWHPWADCHLDSHYDVLAESLIQSKDGAKDPFWDNAARSLLKTALRKYAAQNNTDIETLTTFLFSASEKEFETFFKGTDATTFAFKSNEKTTASIRSVLSSQIEGFRQLGSPQTSPPSSQTQEQATATSTTTAATTVTTTPATTPPAFSIRNWVKNDKPKGFLFITARPDQRQTLTPLISAWVDIAINALMVLPANQKRRLWFIIDELAALQKLPRLQMGLAEGRKYGGCFLSGFQSKPQLEEIYGRNGAESMLDLFNTKLFFRCTEPSSQAWISKVLGDKEEAAPQENISFGANSMRDGVSLSRQTRQTPLVMPAELSQLKDLECYIKLPGNYPCTKIQTKFQRCWFSKKEAFMLKAEKKNMPICLAPTGQVVPTPSVQPVTIRKESLQEID